MQFRKDKRTKSVLICSYKCTLSSCWMTDCLNWISICVFSFRTWLYRFQSSTGHNRLRAEYKSEMIVKWTCIVSSGLLSHSQPRPFIWHMLSRFRVLFPFAPVWGDMFTLFHSLHSVACKLVKIGSWRWRIWLWSLLFEQYVFLAVLGNYNDCTSWILNPPLQLSVISILL